MEKKFFKKVDLRSRKDMVFFLSNHFRYHTMNSWNRSTSYANNMKIYNLGLPDVAYDLLQIEESFDEIRFLIEDWEREQNYNWQVGFNGRSGGYLVLYQGGLEPSGYKSYCTSCGQFNCNTSEKSNRCGRCGKDTRVDFKKTHKRKVTYIGRSTDHNTDFEDWDMDSLRERVKLVQSFDKLCDDIVDAARNLCDNYKVVEEEILVPKKVKVLQPA